MSVMKSFLDYEKNFNYDDIVAYTREHGEIPVFAVCMYLFVVFYGPPYLESRRKFNIKGLVSVWNLLLATFSIIGASRTVPHMYEQLGTHGFKHTVCEHPSLWYGNGAVGLWTALFIYSKIPELLDTVWLVVQKKRVIFLHWFHHATVLLYCWHAYHNTVAPGLWFASMNFSVHSIMYLYYFLMSVGARKVAQLFSMVITTVQILQMVVGATVTYMSAHYYYQPGSAKCHVNPANFKLGLGMYVSYLWLFGVLFVNKYIMGKQPNTKPKKDDTLCGVDTGSLADGAGFFHAEKRERHRKSS